MVLERSFFPVTLGALLGYLPERGAGQVTLAAAWDAEEPSGLE